MEHHYKVNIYSKTLVTKLKKMSRLIYRAPRYQRWYKRIRLSVTIEPRKAAVLVAAWYEILPDTVLCIPELLEDPIKAWRRSSPSTRTSAIPLWKQIISINRPIHKARKDTDHNMPLDMAVKYPCTRIVGHVAIYQLVTRQHECCKEMINRMPTGWRAILMVANLLYPYTADYRGWW